MAETPHYKELLQLLNEFQVEELIVFVANKQARGRSRDLKDLKQHGKGSGSGE
jgi:hypothetical protein